MTDPIITEVEKAMHVLSLAMEEDHDYAWLWHCNIAMASKDEGMEDGPANKAAARFMYNAFGAKYDDYCPKSESEKAEAAG